MTNIPRVTFTTKIWEARPGVTGFRIPEEMVMKLGPHKRPPVNVSLTGYTYPSTIACYGDEYLLPLSKEHREAAGVEAGQMVELTLELDAAPSTVEIPPALKNALSEAGKLDAFETSAPSKKKEWVRQVNEAKAEETRERRIVKIVTEL
jgi:hypothetical protein